MSNKKRERVLEPVREKVAEIEADSEKRGDPGGVEGDLRDDLASMTSDPFRFVLYSFPWGEEGELAAFTGPDKWQTKLLLQIRDKLKSTPKDKLGEAISQVIQEATASGHGVGKSALVSWLILWALSTFEDTKGIVTANTKTQLETKTWAELAKWYRLFIAKHWFKLTATAIYSVEIEHERTWRVDMIPWSEEKTEAFAGLHNQGRRILIIFDEASAIPDKIWEVTEGALTDLNTQILWCVFGNPTRSTGRFHACFHNMRHRWENFRVDSRDSRMANKEQIKKWVEDYGEDSDFVRVRVRGEFPNTSDMQFISSSTVAEARGKHLRINQYDFAPKIIGVDPSWTGGDETVIYLRQGLMSRMLLSCPKNDNDMELAGIIARFEDEEHADGVAIDLGYGTGIYSAGQQLGRSWSLIPFGSGSPDPGFINMRAHMWNQMKEWLKNGASIPNDPVLSEELCAPEAFVVAVGKNAGKIKLESKDDMKSRGLGSPNRADALALTFAINVLPKGLYVPGESHSLIHEYDPFSPERM